MNIWNKTEFLEVAERKRAGYKKVDKRMTFDCFNLRCLDDEVYCSRGKTLSKGGPVSLSRILNGVCFSACKGCSDFNTE